MITVEQSRAARGLLGWTQQDLADASGLSKTAINNFEKKNSDIKVESIKAIYRSFEAMGIVFLGENGVKKIKDRTYTLSGTEGFSLLMNDISHTLSNTTDKTLLLVHARQHHVPHLVKLAQQGINIRTLADSAIHSLDHPVIDHRELNQNGLQTGPSMFIYGHHVALELHEQSAIIILESRDAHQAEKKRFAELWAKSGDQHISRITTSAGQF